jgi:Ca-activated chloride channel family protein
MTSGIELVQPQWLWLLPALIVLRLIIAKLPVASRRPAVTQTRFVHPLIHLITKTGITRSGGRWTQLWQWLVIAGLILALAQPVRIGEQLPQAPQRRDIVLIVSTSVSMVLRDYVSDGKRIDRMTLLKGVLARFIHDLPTDRFAIIVYADAPYTLVPLTGDHRLLTRMIGRIHTVLAGRSNAMGDAIALAVKEAQPASRQPRALVLFTDAALSGGTITPEAAAQLAARAHLPLYTVAIGAPSAGAEEQRRAGLIYHPADLERLRRLAARTGGHAYWAGDSNALSAAARDIAGRVPQAAKLPPRHLRLPLYQWPLLAALGLLALVQFIRLRREYA